MAARLQSAFAFGHGRRPEKASKKAPVARARGNHGLTRAPRTRISPPRASPAGDAGQSRRDTRDITEAHMSELVRRNGGEIASGGPRDLKALAEDLARGVKGLVELVR